MTRRLFSDLVRRGLSKEDLPPLPRCQKKRRALNRDAKKYRNAGRGKIKERVDGVVRKVLPKGSPFDAILDEEMKRIDRMLNDRPNATSVALATGRRARKNNKGNK